MPHVLGMECRGISFVLSWQAWLCGGSVEILPCSRVGHIYQNQEANSPPDREATLLNKVRIAETWLGSFKETFYRHSPEAFALSKVRRACRGFCAYYRATSQRLGQGVSLPLSRGKIEASGLCFPQVVPLKQLFYLVGLSFVPLSMSLGLYCWSWPGTPWYCGMTSMGCDPSSWAQRRNWEGSKGWNRSQRAFSCWAKCSRL